MRINTPFYVHNEKDELVPAKFLVGPDGQYITNPNETPNTINRRATHYFNADGSELRYANPGNYLVVPYNYTLGHALQFVSDLNDAVSQDVSPDMMMAAAFTGHGSQICMEPRYEMAYLFLFCFGRAGIGPCLRNEDYRWLLGQCRKGSGARPSSRAMFHA